MIDNGPFVLLVLVLAGADGYRLRTLPVARREGPAGRLRRNVAAVAAHRDGHLGCRLNVQRHRVRRAVIAFPDAQAARAHRQAARGVVRDLDKALGLPSDEVTALDRGLETDSMAELSVSPTPLARCDRPGWRNLLALSEQLAGFLKRLAQHPGGTLVSSTPLTDLASVSWMISKIGGCSWSSGTVST